MSKESGDYAKKSAEFKRWLALYFIDKGNWKLTDKAIEEFGIDDTPKQTMEFAEVCSDREREERSEYRVGLTAREKKRIAHMKVAGMLEQGKAEELLDSRHVTYFARWEDKIDGLTTVKILIQKLKKDPRDLTKEDFCSNRLVGLLGHYYNNSPYKAVKEAFPEMEINPWEMIQTPHGFFNDKGNRVAAVKWLVDKLKKDPRDLTGEDFHNNRSGGLLANHYNDSPYKAVKEAFPERDIKQWEMAKTPAGFYDTKENRVAAVKWLVEKLKKEPRDLTKEDFHNNRLGGLLHGHYNNSPYEAVKEAFPERDIKQWEMAKTPTEFYDTKENRVAAVKWLVDKLKKDPRDLTQKEFYSNRLGGLLTHYYNGSPYEAVKEAGLVTEADETYMRRCSGARFKEIPSSKEARDAAKKLARNAEKPGPKEKPAKKALTSK